MVKILYLVKEPDRQKMAEEVAVTMGIQVIPHGVTHENREELETVVRVAETEAVDVIMTQGQSFTILREMNVSIPLMPCYFHEEETVSILYHLKKYLRNHPGYQPDKRYRVALITHQELHIDKDMLDEIFGLDIFNRVIRVSNEQEAEEFFCARKKEGVDVVVGGQMYRSCVESEGMLFFYQPGVHSEAMMRKSLSLAKMVAESVTALKRNQKELSATIEYAFEAVLTMDEEGRVVLINQKACQLFSLRREAVVGRKIIEVIPQISEEDISRILHDGGNMYGDLLRTESLVLIVNVTALLEGSRITGAVAHFTELKQLEQLEATVKNQYYIKGHKAKYRFPDILGESFAIQEAKELAARFTDYDANVLLLGETGTGKELFAQSIHNASLRSREPFVALNCGAIPVNLLESELFGYVDGAFTGASRKGKKGLLEIADKGTVFLDEISEMDWQGQAQLLRVLEERTITRVGDDRVIRVDIRVIAASNKNLLKLVEEGKFREDLYYRLNVLTLNIPPLRNRTQDSLILADHFLVKFSRKYKKVVELSSEAREIIAKYQWPGNVRQIRNFCERLAVIARGNMLDADFVIRQMEDVYMIQWSDVVASEMEKKKDISAEVREQESVGDFAESNEKVRIVEALNRSGGNRQMAADFLGISKSSLWRRMKKYNIGEKF
ncbi:MAG: sigma 54-interacting transcriptional regulator [Lachnospiraceae bacterium]|nr:sigma 54-interacting transcriptional regulator [Lachnospiraceae bacterium]